ncbi:MAG: Ligand-binding SRPBCC domain protein family, partial [uncultured Acidimicrobiales bacterium]
DRDERPQRPRGPDHDDHQRPRRHRRAGLAAVGRPAPARALVGSADLPRHRRGPRPHDRRPGHLLHDRTRRQVPRLVGGARRRAAEPVGGEGRVRRRQRDAERRDAHHHDGRHPGPAGRRWHPHGHELAVPLEGGDGAARLDGHGRGDCRRAGPDPRDPGRGRHDAL